MGQLISTVIKTFEEVNDEEKRRKREQLQLLEMLLKSQSDQFDQELRKMLSGSDVGSVKVTKEGPLQSFKESRVTVSSQPSEDIDKILDSLLPTDSQHFDFLKGLKGIIKTGLSTFLGNSNIGEQTKDFLYVCLLNNTIVRIDVKLWMYTFGVKGVIAECEKALCYSYTLSVVDHEETSLDALIFLVTQSANEAGKDPKELIKQLTDLWNSPLRDKTPSKIHKEIMNKIEAKLKLQISSIQTERERLDLLMRQYVGNDIIVPKDRKTIPWNNIPFKNYHLGVEMIIMEIELFYMFPSWKHDKEWFPDWIYYDMPVTEVRKLINAIDNDKTVFNYYLPVISADLRDLVALNDDIKEKQKNKQIDELKQLINELNKQIDLLSQQMGILISVQNQQMDLQQISLQNQQISIPNQPNQQMVILN
ncbi:15733_t:CDS:2 [Dentiscutata erythropus]|uniref:15733_t:CDS:1 n=1 Tax=Dentiscutata erythropus TaxID=1348616 RepID=A0A9N9DDK7_9GLOM|nr:15733_t:CDS:2 [Dentiscutata erythropus]